MPGLRRCPDNTAGERATSVSLPTPLALLAPAPTCPLHVDVSVVIFQKKKQKNGKLSLRGDTQKRLWDLRILTGSHVKDGGGETKRAQLKEKKKLFGKEGGSNE